MPASGICRARCLKDCSRKSRRCRRLPSAHRPWRTPMSATISAKPASDAAEDLTGELLDSYLKDERARRISQRYLPSREAIVEILESVLDLMYPGYFGRQDLNRENLGAHVAQMLAALVPKLEREIE